MSMQTSKNYKGYTAQVFIRPSNGLGAFKASGWSYKVYLHGECVRAGSGLRTEDAAKAEAIAAVQWDIQQKSPR